MSEGELIEIYRETVRPLFASVCAWSGGDRELAEDIVQETYLRAVRHWRDHGLPDRPPAWLRTVARNLFVSAARKQRPRADLAPGELAAEVDDTGPADRVGLRQGLERVGAERAGLLTAFHVEGRSMREIARDEGLSVRAVEGRLRRAREAVRRQLARLTSPDRSAE